MGTKELILSTIEDRLDNVNTNLAKDLMMDVVDRIVNTYKRFRGEVKISRTPQCFISIYKNSTRTWLYFSWLEKIGGILIGWRVGPWPILRIIEAGYWLAYKKVTLINSIKCA